MTLKEVCAYLRVRRLTVYRLIEKGYLPGFKIGGQWRFRKKDVLKYVRKKLFRYGRMAMPHLFFNPKVLEKYQQDTYNYYVHDEAFHGRVGAKEDYYFSKHPGVKIRPGQGFYEVRYYKIELEDGSEVIALPPDELERMPNKERDYWAIHRVSYKK